MYSVLQSRYVAKYEYKHKYGGMAPRSRHGGAACKFLVTHPQQEAADDDSSALRSGGRPTLHIPRCHCIPVFPQTMDVWTNGCMYRYHIARPCTVRLGVHADVQEVYKIYDLHVKVLCKEPFSRAEAPLPYGVADCSFTSCLGLDLAPACPADEPPHLDARPRLGIRRRLLASETVVVVDVVLAAATSSLVSRTTLYSSFDHRSAADNATHPKRGDRTTFRTLPRMMRWYAFLVSVGPPHEGRPNPRNSTIGDHPHDGQPTPRRAARRRATASAACLRK
ncbi:hypothetical protein RJ55_02821 [Drechmeria coniospora]|nr:hypothetical protein RJ55_02821 [Drechmeria coniospora]